MISLLFPIAWQVNCLYMYPVPLFGLLSITEMLPRAERGVLMLQEKEHLHSVDWRAQGASKGDRRPLHNSSQLLPFAERVSCNAEASNFSRHAEHSDFLKHGVSQFINVKKKKSNTLGDSDQNGKKAALGYEAQTHDLWKPVLSPPYLIVSALFPQDCHSGSAAQWHVLP